ncbi:MAG: ABC transporter [Rickettsiales bacterium]|nr:ABC transporter [Rickettsiales bacterium]
MNIIKTIFKKELYDYFNSPIAYIYILIFLIVSHIYFFKNLFIYNQASMLSLFNFSPYFFFFLISAISMRVWSEEKKSGTLDFLFTFPLKDYQLVLGKFFAALLFIAVILFSTLPFVAVVMYLGNPDILPIITGYFGLILLAAANLSLGFFLSSLTQNQIISFLLTALLSVFSFLLTPQLFCIPSLHFSLLF